MKNLRHLLLSILSGIICSFSWPYVGDMEWLIFIGLVPLLLVERELGKSDGKHTALRLFLFSYLAFLIFNTGTTWWIKLASPGGMVLAEVFNSLFMSIVFLLFHFTRKYINNKVGYAALIFYWVGFEWLHINWELSWIWLNLGNVFANRIHWVQWYEYTGTLGGSLWILSVNVLIFNIVYGIKKSNFSLSRSVFAGFALVCLLAIPLCVSHNLFNNYEETENPVEVVIVQPNIDPYRDKFGGMHEYEQIDRLLELSKKEITEKTDLVFGPETAFPLGYWEHELDYIYGTEQIRKLIEQTPGIKYIVGLSSIKLYVKGEEMSATARPFNDGSGNKYDYFNTVMQIDSSDKLQIYRKSKLVLGVEKMPFSGKLGFLDKLSIKLGGASGSLGVEKAPKLFKSFTEDGREINVIPAICYESIYGEYLSEFVKMGGNVLGIVTNDGWWGKTPGYEQHLAYSRLRAIELRRSIARSANTGISALIDQKGQITKRTDWWTPDSFKGTLNLNSDLTFYTEHGDYIGRIFGYFSLLLVAWMIVSAIRKSTGIGRL